MKTLAEVNIIIDLFNKLTDLFEKTRIPNKYSFNHNIDKWEIQNIYSKDKKRFEYYIQGAINLYERYWEK